jgi:hypothetical protein
MSDGSSNKDTDILVLAVFLFLFFVLLLKYVPQIVTYPWAVFVYLETYYIKTMLNIVPQMPWNNITECIVFIMLGLALKVLLFNSNFAKFLGKKTNLKLLSNKKFLNNLFYMYFAFFSSTSVLIYFNSDNFYYDISSINDRLSSGNWKDLKYSNVFKVDFFLLPFNAVLVIPCLLYMASKFTIMPKSKTRHNLESLIRNLSGYFGFNRYLITYNPIANSKEINPSIGYHGVSFKSNAYLKENGVICDVIDRSGEVHCSFLDNRKLYTVFSYQAGPAFTSFEEMEEKHKWVAVCFALIVMGNREQAEQLNYKIGFYYNKKEKPPEKDQTWLDEKVRNLKFAFNKDYGRTEINRIVNEAIKKIKANKNLMTIASQHGFVYSLICRLQKEAASKGKTPPNHYYWIFFEDRILGMVICEQGKPGFSIEAYAPNSIAENEMVSKKPMRMPDISDVVKKLENYLIDEFAVYLYRDEATARIILEQESFKLQTTGALPKYGYWSLRYIKAPNEIPTFVKDEKLKYPTNWSEEMKRHAVIAHIPEAGKG